MTERDKSCVPSVDVPGSVFRPSGRAALGSVILVVLLGEPCVDVQTIDKAPLLGWLTKSFWGMGPVLADRRPQYLSNPTSFICGKGGFQPVKKRVRM